MVNRVFFPQAALDLLVGSGDIGLEGEELVLGGGACRYRIVEAVRVVREVGGAEDPHDLCGRVKSRQYLTELGAELLGESMIVGDNAYDVVAGFVGVPGGDFDPSKAGKTEEQLLGEVLQQVT